MNQYRHFHVKGKGTKERINNLHIMLYSTYTTYNTCKCAFMNVYHYICTFVCVYVCFCMFVLIYVYACATHPYS